jgi:hypothetical protein
LVLIIYYCTISIIELLRDSRNVVRALNEFAEVQRKTRNSEDMEGKCDKCNRHFQKLSHHMAHCKAK